LLTTEQLKEMGVDKIGERLYLMQIIVQAKKEQRFKARMKVLWQDQEIIHTEGCLGYIRQFGCLDYCAVGCGCQDVPDAYKLTGSALTLKRTDIVPCPSKVFCCQSGERHVDHIDLSNVTDVDVISRQKNCFSCSCYADEVLVEVHEQIDMPMDAQQGGANTSQAARVTDHRLKVYDGDKVAMLLRNAVEENQMMERQ
jgi:hypothetical protein